jgi:molecular chaperone HscB
MTPQSKFAVLGVPERYDLPADELEQRYHELSLKLHPDRAPKGERGRALSAATALNDAYRALRSPVGRAEHLLELSGRAIGDNEPVAQDFLLDVLELRERAAAKDPSVRPEVAARRAEALARLPGLFAAGRLDEAKDQLIALRYFDRLLAEEDS